MVLRFNLNKSLAANQPATHRIPPVNASPLLPLEFLRPGEWGEVAEVSGEAGWICRLAELGVRVGCRLQMLQGGCPCLLQVGGCRLSLRGECSQHILVRPVSTSSR